MNHLFLKAFKNQKGQTSVEYIMLVGVMAIITFSVMQIVQDRINPEGLDCEANPEAFFCTVSRLLPERGYDNFRYFAFR